MITPAESQRRCHQPPGRYTGSSRRCSVAGACAHDSRAVAPLHGSSRTISRRSAHVSTLAQLIQQKEASAAYSVARYPIGCGSSSVRGMLLSVSKCRTLLSVLSFSLSHSVGYTSVGWLGRDSDSILYNTNSSHAPLAQTTGDRRRAGRYRRQVDSEQQTADSRQ